MEFLCIVDGTISCHVETSFVPFYSIWPQKSLLYCRWGYSYVQSVFIETYYITFYPHDFEEDAWMQVITRLSRLQCSLIPSYTADWVNFVDERWSWFLHHGWMSQTWYNRVNFVADWIDFVDHWVNITAIWRCAHSISCINSFETNSPDYLEKNNFYGANNNTFWFAYRPYITRLAATDQP